MHLMLLFLLAHQDDELMVSPIIADAKRKAETVAIVFLTDGGGGAATPATRNDETRRALTALGVNIVSEVFFLGEREGIADGILYRHMNAAHDALKALSNTLSRVSRIYTHAWEGGNPDHDAAYVLALGTAQHLGISDQVFQVPFYRATRRGLLPFNVLAPLDANGPVIVYPVSRFKRLKMLTLIRYFPSQIEAFVRLGPFMVLKSLWQPGLLMQRATWSRIGERPMTEPLRYERHGHDTFDRIQPYLQAYAGTVMGPLSA